MSGPENNVAITTAAYRAFNAGGIEAILEYIDPGIEWRMWDRFSRAPRVYRGHEGVREVLAVFEENYDNFRADPGEMEATGDYVITPVRLHGLEKGSGEHQAFDLVQVWRTEADKAVQLDVYSTLEEARAAVSSSSTLGEAGSAR